MPQQIALIDYGMGNLRSVGKALELVGADVRIVSSPARVGDFKAIVLPGVGSFGPALNNLKRQKLFDSVRSFIGTGRMFLGLCLGFQFLFETSFEEGCFRGFGLIEGTVEKFALKSKKFKIPHMGWNNVLQRMPNAKEMFKGIPDKTYFYFVHSFIAKPKNKSFVSGVTEYGDIFCSSVTKDNIWACQFHPEKSGKYGLKLLQNFVTCADKRI